MNMPSRIGDRYMCFVVVREDKGWGGRYGTVQRPTVLMCEDCGYKVRGVWAYELKRMADHHEHGHAPCARCGALLLKRKDGSARQHPHNRCPVKNAGDKVEREFVKNMTAREYA